VLAITASQLYVDSGPAHERSPDYLTGDYVTALSDAGVMRGWPWERRLEWGRAALVSTQGHSRHRRRFEQSRYEIVRMALHEVGRTLGLRYCDDPRCAMSGGASWYREALPDNDVLCPRCRDALERNAPMEQSAPAIAPLAPGELERYLAPADHLDRAAGRVLSR
jgi:hypothetical protein